MISHLLDKYYIKQPKVRKLLTKLLYGDEDKRVNLLGSETFLNCSEENGYLRASRFARVSSLFRDEIPIILALASRLRPESTFVDVGANIGLYSIQMSKFKRLYRNFGLFER